MIVKDKGFFTGQKWEKLYNFLKSITMEPPVFKVVLFLFIHFQIVMCLSRSCKSPERGSLEKTRGASSHGKGPILLHVSEYNSMLTSS